MSPMMNLIMKIRDSLQTTGIPVKARLPDESVPEPFIVIGTHFEDDSQSGKIGKVTTTELQIDLFYAIDNRAELEDAIYEIKRLIYNSTQQIIRVTSNTITDNSVGRDVFHVIFLVSAYL
ncbi:hypothetical protein FKV75_00335 [Weissella paramesenteroides]|nr:hypothetical protein FKV77_05340 [Weissella paramesenteroides]KAA8442991.1 hypothetical protein FKV81_01330 [Weissella paramesenteroides]KAA8444333.1 hypothetical protein FKV75_00335 [Weissella paramesenteroides]KAA8448001.1 hypothetical protein FKV76_01900 [Weissella paramesenteroides]KAA8452186.1 hypothetical protein FKV74_01330 [Weissella paramesenteroides]